MTKIYRTQKSIINLDKVLDIGGFDLDRMLKSRPTFLEPERPYEWAGVFKLEAGTHHLKMCAHHHAGCGHGDHDHHHDHGHGHGDHHHHHGDADACDFAVLMADSADESGLTKAENKALTVFSMDAHSVPNGAILKPGEKLFQLEMGEDGHDHDHKHDHDHDHDHKHDHGVTYKLKIEKPGAYAIFTQMRADELHLQLFDPKGTAVSPAYSRIFQHEHEHNEEVFSVGIQFPGTIDPNKLNKWIGKLLGEKGPDIFRMKGVLNIKGEDKRFVFQGVHMLFDGAPDRPWKPNEDRLNQFVFIGRKLDREALMEGFKSCLAR